MIEEAGIATFEEIRRYWDICDVEEVTQLIDIQKDAEWLEGERIRREAGK